MDKGEEQYISKLDKDHGLIREIAREGEVVYRDKCYRCTGKCHYETGNEISPTEHQGQTAGLQKE